MLLRAPSLHCLALGLIPAWMLAVAEPPPPIEIDRARIEKLARAWEQQTGRRPGPEQLAVLIGEAIDDEVLYREALALRLDQLPAVRDRLVKLANFLDLTPDESDNARLRAAIAAGLDRSDPIVRRYMTGAMKEQLGAAVRVPSPTDAEVERFRREHEGEFREPARVRLSHVYVGGLGEQSQSRAKALGDRLAREGATPSDAIGWGDAFYAGHGLPWLSEAGLAARFGDGFARSAIQLEVGGWSQPIASSYGFHLVFAREVLPARSPTLDEVAPAIRRRMVRARLERAVEIRIASLAEGYLVFVAGIEPTRAPERVDP